MQEYRAYIIGDDGHIQFRIDLVCRDEADARERAMALAEGHDIELWQEDHVIAMYRPGG